MGLRVVVTGAGGFLGSRLAASLLSEPQMTICGQTALIEELRLVDRVDPPAALIPDPRTVTVVVDLSADTADLSFVDGADVIFHLAAAVSADCEADFDLGMRSNLSATIRLLQRCRAEPEPPLFVFASSVAVFGPGPVDDDALPMPQSSYGTQKLVCEYLIADCTRRNFVRGRCVRLMTVSVRPGRPNGAASSFLSGVVREPLSGSPTTVPARPDDEVAIASPSRTVAGLLRAASATDAEWGDRPLNLPSLRITVADMVTEVISRSPTAAQLITWSEDPGIRRIVQSWPSRFDMSRAANLGLFPDTSFAELVDEFVRDR